MNTIDDFEVIDYIPAGRYPPDAWVSVDLEIFGGVEGKLHRPLGEFSCLSLTSDGKQVCVLTDLEEMKHVVPVALENCGVIFQGGLFDLRQLRRWISFPPRQRYHDTLYIDRILWGGYYDRFGLNHLTRRYLDSYLEKESRVLFSKADALTQEMLEYNARDAVATYRVAMKQMQLMKKSHRRVWYEIDMPTVWALLDFKGIMVDRQKWEDIALEMETVAIDIEQRFSINPRSPKQVQAFFEREGIDLSAGTGDEILARMEKLHPLIPELRKYRKFHKRSSTYGQKWADENIEADGRVYTSIDPNRAESGRTASSDPNLQNIPVRDTPVYRNCFIAAPGCKLVGGDFGQQEIRNCAFLSQDDVLISLLKNKDEDIYAQIASEIHGRKITKKDKERQDAKGVVLGAIYYLTSIGLTKKLNNERGPDDPEWTEKDAQKLLDKFFERFQKTKIWMEGQQIKIGSTVRTPVGRKIWINEHNYQAPNNACNAPNQGGGADMLKKALALLHAGWNPPVPEPFPVVLEIHDEIVLEVLEANVEYAKEFLLTCMLQAAEFCTPGIPSVVDIKVGDNWGEIH